MSNLTAANSTRTTNAFTRARNRILTPLLAIAGAIFLPALLLPPPAMAQAPAVCSATGNETVAAGQAELRARRNGADHGRWLRESCSVALDVYVPDGTVNRATVHD